MINIIKETNKQVKKFKCGSDSCGCEFESDEWCEEYGITKHKCPRCNSSDTLTIIN